MEPFVTPKSEGMRENSYHKKESLAVAATAVAVGKVYTAGVWAFQRKHRNANPWPNSEGASSPPLTWSRESLLGAEKRAEKGREGIWKRHEPSSSWVIVKIRRDNI